MESRKPIPPELEKIISELVALAFEKGIDKATKKALSLHDPFVLDEFHDRLEERVYRLAKSNK